MIAPARSGSNAVMSGRKSTKPYQPRFRHHEQGAAKDHPPRPRTTPRVPSIVLSREELLARVLYRDALVLVVDKPSGIPVHAGPGGGPNLEELFDALRFGLPRPPSLAHRLDRDTSGCLVLGRHPKALRKAGAMFAAGKAKKVYWAVVEGVPKKPEGLITFKLRKATPGKGWKMIVHPHGQDAVTAYKVRGTAETPNGVRSWLELEPQTGRTHQIRVHCAEIGCPVLGDPVYGPQPSDPASGPLQLHARSIALPLSPSRPPIKVTAPPPPHMLADLKACGFTGD